MHTEPVMPSSVGRVRESFEAWREPYRDAAWSREREITESTASRFQTRIPLWQVQQLIREISRWWGKLSVFGLFTLLSHHDDSLIKTQVARKTKETLFWVSGYHWILLLMNIFHNLEQTIWMHIVYGTFLWVHCDLSFHTCMFSMYFAVHIFYIFIVFFLYRWISGLI